ncbi:response regulator receiver modulated diguanylate cyclase/phosphodiesterase with PAS/PAC sensor(s) [Methylophaga frappieri]|uniref:Response regulator receiver modulated diguanylate cyclase/phosphodiesterase with PAS/PAC sensor(S) n=1 Tax=Methylophaga frappieri (strain ATCC BAA-2434 / DSM 25690 / JAM7) TaxID=754477 RepID=I1YK88_METFJ|nr:EAL domain-containing protein [Methylophaga frappieri]AFJ03331.1 response regulator receiver modulated diguanylate cyclase/phosphodiesterase with PAS/PAC sensor(s) [Methylophaga frappieri]
MARSEGILRLLIVDDSLTDSEAVINVLRSAGHAVRANREDRFDALEQVLSNQTWDLLICRDHLPSLPPLDIINLAQRLGKDLPCIVLCQDLTLLPALFHGGAHDVVSYQDVERLQFAAAREITSLQVRRLARRNERALRESEKRSQALLESSRDAVAYMHEGMHIYVNRAYLNLFGYEEAEDIDGLPILDLIAAEDHNKFKAVFRQFTETADALPQTVAVQCLKEEGHRFSANIEFSHARVEGEDCTQVVIRDESVSSDDSNKLQLLRDHDLLTGLYSRARFEDEMEKAISAAAEGRGDAELLFIVLDDFQAIKAQVGLGTSDVVIKSIAELLRRTLIEGEVLGRYADQVFTVIVPSANEREVDQRAEIYRRVVDDYVSQANGKIIDLHCSIGISRITENIASAAAALENADRACVRAQRSGGNQVARYQPDTETASASAQQWQTVLQSALKENNFFLNFQPIISLHGPEQELYEVLLRLTLPSGKTIKADDFIASAATLEIMAEVDKWVIRQALQSLKQVQIPHPKTRFFIKLSEQTLHETGFVDWLSATLQAHDIKGSALVFEISETAAVDNLEQSKQTISRLKEIGCEFGLEHFGSGIDFSHSLTILDVDYLKINGNFVENMAQDPENQTAVKAIIEMARQAKKYCIAEFVSDANSLALLWRFGVDYAQGYYIQEPAAELYYNFDDEA